MDQHSGWEIPIVACDFLVDFETLSNGGVRTDLRITALLAWVRTSKRSAEFPLDWESR